MNYVYFTSVTWRYDIRRQLSIFDSKCALRRVPLRPNSFDC